MSKRHHAQQDAAEAKPAPILPALDIRPDGIYRPAQIQAALGLGGSALRGEWRQGRLRIIRRCNRNFVLGRDVLAWLDGGELPSPCRRMDQNRLR